MKTLLGYAIVIGTVLLFVVAYFAGSGEEPKVVQAEPEAVKTYEAPAAEEKTEEEEIAEVVDLSLPTETDKTEAIDVATDFVKLFHKVDPDDPYAYVENSKDYMTLELYRQYKGIPKRGTLETARLTVEHAELLPVELNDRTQVWTAQVTSEQESADGTLEMVYDELMILLQKDGEGWNVDGVKLNER